MVSTLTPATFASRPMVMPARIRHSSSLEHPQDRFCTRVRCPRWSTASTLVRSAQRGTARWPQRPKAIIRVMDGRRQHAPGIQVKTPDEIEKMRVAGRLASEVLDFIAPHVVPGVTTGKLDKLCHDYMVE